MVSVAVIFSLVLLSYVVVSLVLVRFVRMLGLYPERLFAPVFLLELTDEGFGVIQALIVGFLLVQLQQGVQIVGTVVVGFTAALVEHVGQQQAITQDGRQRLFQRVEWFDPVQQSAVKDFAQFCMMLDKMLCGLFSNS